MLGYMTRSIPADERHEPIYILELKALLHGLHHFRQLIRSAPATIVLTDSRSVWCLLHQGLSETILKLQRWSVAIAQKYHNLLFYMIPSAQNAADFLSRQFNVPKRQVAKIKLDVAFRAPVTELEDQLLTMEEAAAIANANPQYLSACTLPKETKASVNSLSNTQIDALSEALLPITELKSRLSPNSIIPAQKRELKEVYETALTVPTQDQTGDLKYTIINGVLAVYVTDDTPVIYVPPSAEDLVIAYHHLVSGHRLGRVGLYHVLKEVYFFPEMRKKTENFVALCLNCTLTHPISTRKAMLGKALAPAMPMEVLYLDAVNLRAKHKGGVTDYLSVVDAFSKFVSVFPLSSLSDRQIIKHLTTFFAHMGVCRYIVADNATMFRSQRFLSFCSKLGIHVIYSSAY